MNAAGSLDVTCLGVKAESTASNPTLDDRPSGPEKPACNKKAAARRVSLVPCHMSVTLATQNDDDVSLMALQAFISDAQATQNVVNEASVRFIAADS